MTGKRGDCGIQERVFLGLEAQNLIYRSDDALRFGLDDGYYRAFIADAPLANLFQHEHAAPYQAVITMNIRKYTLAAQSFGTWWSLQALSYAAAFALLGCLLDDKVDEGDHEQRRNALMLLDWDHGCGNYAAGKVKGGDSLAELILAKLGAFLQSISETDSESYEKLVSELHQAATAEYLGSVPSHTPADLQYAMDRSVLFVLAGFRFAASGRLSAEEERLCRLVGEVMCIVDDLCDLDEDERHGRINSILCRARNDSELLSMIDDSFLSLDRSLLQLRQGFSREFYEFLLYELRRWSLGNAYIRERTWRGSYG
ncbi:MAG: hypothetical protein J1F18_12555 [Lachnospiraceae bacterium]|nr:hypothetical protein [Lachnospiraceae bacterium]